MNNNICQDAWMCDNMKEVLNDLDMDVEHYECKVCKRTIKLYYDGYAVISNTIKDEETP